MSVTLLEVLQNAKINLQNVREQSISTVIAKQQIHNAVILLEKGYSLYDVFEEITKGMTVEEVKEKEVKEKEESCPIPNTRTS